MSNAIEMMMDGIEWVMIEPPSLEEQAQAAVNGTPYATHFGVLQIAGVDISCVTLSDGRRLITEQGMANFLDFLQGKQTL